MAKNIKLQSQKRTFTHERVRKLGLFFSPCFSKNPQKAKPFSNSPNQSILNLVYGTLLFLFKEVITNNSGLCLLHLIFFFHCENISQTPWLLSITYINYLSLIKCTFVYENNHINSINIENTKKQNQRGKFIQNPNITQRQPLFNFYVFQAILLSKTSLMQLTSYCICKVTPVFFKLYDNLNMFPCHLQCSKHL